MKLHVNGTPRDTAAATLSQLIAELRLPPQATLAELNGEALSRSEWDARPLRDGDRIELLRVAAGG